MPTQVRILHLPPTSAVEPVETKGPLTWAFARQGPFVISAVYGNGSQAAQS